MAYACASADCERLNYWSNPDVFRGGVAMGTTGTNNNARVLNETALRVANFRTGGATGPNWHAWEHFAGTLATNVECLTFSATPTDCWAELWSGALGWWRYNGSAAPVRPAGYNSSAAELPYAAGKWNVLPL